MSDALNRDLRDLARRDAAGEAFDDAVEGVWARIAHEEKALLRELRCTDDELTDALRPLVEAAASK